MWEEKKELTGGVVDVHVGHLSAVSEEEGLDIVVLVRVERGDLLHSKLWVYKHDHGEGHEELTRKGGAVIGRQQPQLRVELHKAGERRELGRRKGTDQRGAEEDVEDTGNKRSVCVCVCVSGREAKRDVGKDKLIQRERDREIDERDKRKWR